ncbi:Ger(x)C family spore germination protein [Solibacillus isronensis]|uniref:Ger(x)C family spore germination protein n=1 Tax=Solibacillus isronensis TaxID=412383 RepID=UPI0009A6406C|nr:Ger(x)C family spore germination protein [Solibacillus isronensis]
MPNPFIKTKFAIILFFFSLFFLTGCAFKDIDKSVFVAMIAIDKSDEEDKPYKITLKLYEPTGSFKEATQPGYSYLTQTGETLSEAIRILQSYSDKELEFGHSKLIIIGEELLKEDRSKEILDFLLRRPDIQMISWIAVGKPSAEEVIKIIPQGETVAYPELFNYFDHNGTTSQYIVTTYLFDFRRNMEERGIDTVVPIIKVSEEGKHFEINKSLVLADKKEPFELDYLNTAIFNMLTEETKHADFLIKRDDEHFIARIDTIKPDYKVNIKKSENIELELKVGLYGYISESKKPLLNRDLPKYNKLLKEEGEEIITEFITKMIEEGYDPLGFGIDYKGKVLHNRRMSDTEWEEAYKNAQIKVTVAPGLKSTGTIQ